MDDNALSNKSFAMTCCTHGEYPVHARRSDEITSVCMHWRKARSESMRVFSSFSSAWTTRRHLSVNHEVYASFERTYKDKRVDAVGGTDHTDCVNAKVHPCYGWRM